MTIRFDCPCGQTLSAPDSKAGKSAQCPKCGSRLTMPSAPTSDRSRPARRAPDRGRPSAPAPTVKATLVQNQTTTPPRPARLSAPTAKQSSAPAGQSIESPLDLLSDLPPAAPNPPPHPTTTRRYRLPTAGGKSKKQQRKWLLGSLVACAVVLVGGVGVWAVSVLVTALSGGRNDSVAASFEPLVADGQVAQSTGRAGESPLTTADAPASAGSQVTGRNTTESAMLKVAERFVSLAEQNDHHAAVALIDKKLFQARLHGKGGSYEAMYNDISSGELLKNFATYALDGAPLGGLRHWEILGVSTFEGLPGIVLRYYVEPSSAAEEIGQRDTFERLAALVDFDQFMEAASGIFTQRTMHHSLHDSQRLDTHAISRAFTPRAGYMMLVMDTQQTTPRLVDLVNILGDAPLSKTGAAVFLDDYHVFGAGMARQRDFFGAEAIGFSRYGIVPRASGMSWKAGDEQAKRRAEAKHAASKAKIAQMRPIRLEALMALVIQNSPKVDDEIARFQSDFPNDLGFEMALLLNAMAPTKPYLPKHTDRLLTTAADRLFEKWQDTFLLYVKGLNARAHDREQEADRLMAQCQSVGFSTTALHFHGIQQALDQRDGSQTLVALKGLSQLWDSGQPQDEPQVVRLKDRWQRFEKSLEPPPPSLQEQFGSGRDRRFGPPGQGGPGRFDPTAQSGPPSFDRPGSSDRPGTDRSATGIPSGNRSQGNSPSPFGGMRNRTGPTPPTITDPVVIRMVSESRFDGNRLAKQLATALGVKNYRFSQRNNEGTLRIDYQGAFATIVEKIHELEVGNIEATDENAKEIEIGIP